MSAPLLSPLFSFRNCLLINTKEGLKNEDGTGVFTSFFEEREITWTVGENGAVVSLGETDLSLKRLEDMLLLVSPGNENGDMYYYFEKKAE